MGPLLGKAFVGGPVGRLEELAHAAAADNTRRTVFSCLRRKACLCILAVYTGSYTLMGFSFYWYTTTSTKFISTSVVTQRVM